MMYDVLHKNKFLSKLAPDETFLQNRFLCKLDMKNFNVHIILFSPIVSVLLLAVPAICYRLIQPVVVKWTTPTYKSVMSQSDHIHNS